MRKGLIYLLIILALIILTGIFFVLRNNRHYKGNDAIKSIPLDAALIIRISDIESVSGLVLKDIEYKKELEAFSLTSKLYGLVQRLDSDGIFRENSFEVFKHKNVFVSFHLQGKNSIKALFATTSDNKAEENEMRDWITGLADRGFAVRSKKYDAATIYSIKNKRTSKVFYLSPFRGFVIGSYSNLLVEQSVRQLQAETSLLSDPAFFKVYRTGGNTNPANLYVNFAEMPGFLSAFFKDRKKIPSVFKVNNSLWAELDVDVKSKEMEMNGFIAGDSSNLLNELLKGMKPQKPRIMEVFPFDTKIYFSYCMESPEEFRRGFHSYLKTSGNELKYESLLKKIKKNKRVDVEEELFSFLESEMALVYAGLNPAKPEGNAFLIAETRGKSFSLDKMKKLIQALEGRSLQPVENYKVDEETTFPVYSGLPEDLLEHVMGWFFPTVPQKYFSFYDNYIIFSESLNSLHDFLYANVLKKTLVNKRLFMNFRENFSLRENFFFYSEIPVAAGLLENILKKGYTVSSQEQKKALAKFYAAGMQISSTGDMLYSTVYANYLPFRENEPQTVWQSLLDSTVINKPVLVRNHYTNEKELIVQDAKYNIYLINNSGRILWKKTLDGRILGDIEQIDYYRNSKLQYIFNTKNKIYLLDRNGNNVDRYPLTLPAKATNGIAVMDYENNRDYRIFLATADRRVRLFDKRGNKISGWEFKRTEGTVTQPVQHFRSRSKDYIVFSDDHKVYILNRRGYTRVKPGKHVVAAKNCKIYIKGRNTPDCKLVTASPRGELIFIDLPTGVTTVKKIMEKTDNFGFIFYEQNNSPRYVFLLHDKLKIFDKSLKALVSKSFKGEMALSIDKYMFSKGNYKLGLLSRDKQHIFLINSDGTTYKGFPLRGSSRFSIGFLKSSSSRFNLVVGGDNNYIYNYGVE